MYQKITEDQVPKRGRKSEYLFESTPEWVKAKADIDKGLKPATATRKAEVLHIGLTDADKLEYRITSRRTVARFVKMYIDENELPYIVKSYRRDGVDYVDVRHPAPKRRVRKSPARAS